MKTIKQLGISPAPWTMVVEDKRDYRLFSVEAENGAGIADFDCCPEQFDTHEGFANASLISAATDLYEAARRAYVFLAHSSLIGAAEVRAELEGALLKAGGAE